MSDLEAEIQRLHERIEAIEKSHVVSLRLMEETSESWRLAHQAWSEWARELLYDVGRQLLHGEHGDTAAMAIIEQLARMAPGVPRCSRCGCFSTLHEVDDEELRECSDCECTQYEA